MDVPGCIATIRLPLRRTLVHYEFYSALCDSLSRTAMRDSVQGSPLEWTIAAGPKDAGRSPLG